MCQEIVVTHINQGPQLGVDHSWDHLLVPAAVNPSDEGTYRNTNTVL